MKYYAMIDGKRYGPYELEELANAGVRPGTYIWCKGMDDWEKAEDVADVCRMFRIRLYDLMHPSQSAPAEEVDPSEIKDISSAGNDQVTPSGMTRFDRALNDAGAPHLPSLEEIEERDNNIPPSPFLLPIAIFVTIIGFMPAGIVAIIYSIKARKAWNDSPGSKEAGHFCRAAKMWTGIAFFIGMILYAFLFRFS